VIYFITNEREVKVGYTQSKSLFRRLKHLQIGNSQRLRILATCDGDFTAEFNLHCRFRNLRIRGEWFNLNDELAALIRSCDDYKFFAAHSGDYKNSTKYQSKRVHKAKLSNAQFIDRIVQDLLFFTPAAELGSKCKWLAENLR
jgi:hypothetical protein